MFKLIKLLIIYSSLKLIISQTDRCLNLEKCGIDQIDRGIHKYSAGRVLWSNGVSKTDNKCLASIINEYWLIGAASCLWDYNNPKNYYVQFPGMQEVEVQEIVRSPKYNPTLGAGYDIALIKLRFELDFNSEPLIPTCLPLTQFDIKPGSCQIVRSQTNDPKIRIQHIKEVEFKDCHDKYKNLVNEKYMTCAGDSLACISDGDTGGPLFCKNSTNPGEWILTGIASWRQSQSTPVHCGPNPDVFTKLFDNDYINWINSTICVNKKRN